MGLDVMKIQTLDHTTIARKEIVYQKGHAVHVLKVELLMFPMTKVQIQMMMETQKMKYQNAYEKITRRRYESFNGTDAAIRLNRRDTVRAVPS